MVFLQRTREDVLFQVVQDIMRFNPQRGFPQNQRKADRMLVESWGRRQTVFGWQADELRRSENNVRGFSCSAASKDLRGVFPVSPQSRLSDSGTEEDRSACTLVCCKKTAVVAAGEGTMYGSRCANDVIQYDTIKLSGK